MKYEFKPFSHIDFPHDLNAGWTPTFRVAEEYGGTPRRVIVTDLGQEAKPSSRLASIDIAEGGAVRLHDYYGRFGSDGIACVLDLILFREIPETRERTIQGTAYLNANGTVAAIRNAEDHLVHLDPPGDLKPVPCTITLHEPQ